MQYPKKSSRDALHEKLLAVRRSIFRHEVGIYTSMQLASELLFSLAVAVKKGVLPAEHSKHFTRESREALLTELLQEAQRAFAYNKLRYRVPKRSHGCSDAQMNLRKNVYRLTREELCERYGIEDWWRRDPHKYTLDDVLYGAFLRSFGFNDRQGAQVSEADLVPA